LAAEAFTVAAGGTEPVTVSDFHLPQQSVLALSADRPVAHSKESIIVLSGIEKVAVTKASTSNKSRFAENIRV